MIKKTLVLFFATYLIISQAIAQAPKSYSSSEILLQLKKLNTVGAVLYIAAHPDDENTRLITYLANEKCLRTGYLSLTRGDGGQNLIGPEQGIELGVIRTQELLAARRIDGGEQFFTRAYDFGFSKSPEETFKKWNKDSILSDMVWVIRNFRPDIIITRFAPDGSGGHGHHTASAILAEEAFDAAADPTRFPEQLQYVEVWKTRRMFYNTVARFRNPNADMSAYIPLDVGGYNPLLGKSYGEIAAESRSMHKSQGFGSAKQRGEYFEHFKPVKGDTAGLKDIFEGIDFSWKRHKKYSKYHSKILNLIKNYPTSFKLSYSSNLITLASSLEKNYIELNYHDQLINNIIINYHGIFYESISKQPSIGFNDTINVETTYMIRENRTITKYKAGFRPFGDRYDDATITLRNNFPYVYKSTYPIHLRNIKSNYQKLYWLENPIKNNLFDYNFQKEVEKDPSLSRNIFVFSNEGNVTLQSEIQYKWVDPEKGELYRPVVITPPVMINIENDVITFADNKPKELKVVLKAGKDSVNGWIKIALPKGWFAILKGSKMDGNIKTPDESGFTFS
ncbi:MAG: PIG-L family deacetylase [Bacteroidia bacterium]|nr:PIG-L family deacetylase [Bacteroidia bacterium]